MREELNELALFAGAGGGILGGKLLGWRTVCAVEIEPYPASVLVQRQNDGILSPFPIWDDIRTFDGRPWRGIVDVVSGGFPCQDISAAGRGEGITGERSGLWKEMARIISEVRPTYAFVENSPMLTTRGFGTVLGDLAEMGFDAEWGVLSAADVGAPHLRERIWIVAYSESNGNRREPGNVCKADGRQVGQMCGKFICTSEKSEDMAHSNKTKSERLSIRTPAQDTWVGKHCENVAHSTSIRQSRQRESIEQRSKAQTGNRETNIFKPISIGKNGRLNPTWVEWLMGWPLEWTDLKPLAMGKFLELQQQHSISSEKD